MPSKGCRVRCNVAVLFIVLMSIVSAIGQGQKVALYVQAVAPVPSAQLENIRSFANQRCAAITGVGVCSTGELMYAQRLTKAYLGNAISVAGIRKLAQAMGADHIVIFRIVRWEDQISFKPERSLLLLGATSFLDEAVRLVVSPLGLLFGLEKEATVGLLMTVVSPAGDVEFTTTVTYADRPLFSLITADPLEAAKRAVEAALYQLAVVI